MPVLSPSADPFKVYKYGDPEILRLTTKGRFRTGQIQDYEQILSQYSGSNGWVDPEFPHTDESVGNIDGALDTANADVQANSSSVKWFRIKDFVPTHAGSRFALDIKGNETPVFSVGSLGRQDIFQGSVGNCWFVAALSAVTEDSADIGRVVPADNHTNDAGVYHFRFWLQGIWIDVPVDDYIPCKFSDQEGADFYYTVGARLKKVGNQVEFWVALLEKAYAKLMGTYAITAGNQPVYALENLTGGFGESRNFQEGVEPGLYTLIKGLLDKSGGVAQRSIICLSLLDKLVGGLIGPHAYSVTAAATVYENGGGAVDLLRIRNPHGHKGQEGNGEWLGDWSDPPANDYYSNSGSRWDNVSEDQKKALGVESKDDGEFYMAWNDVIRAFTSIDIVNIVRENELQKADWNAYHGEWSNANNTAGGKYGYPTFADNPQATTTVTAASGTGLLFATMVLKLNLKAGIPDCWGFSVFRVENESENPPFDAYFFQQSEEIQAAGESEVVAGMQGMEAAYKTTARAFKVPSGKYVVVPYLQKPGEEGKFCLRILNQTS